MSAHPQTDLSIPKTQKVAIFQKSGGPVEIKDAPVVQADALEAGQVLVKVMYSGVCHTDLHALLGDWPMPSKLPLIGGHEGAGFVVAVGKGTSAPIKVGQAVGIKWLATSCLSCEACARGQNESVCADAQCSGYTVDGSFQQYAVSYAAHVTPIPESIGLDLAAPILCAGVTVFKAIKQAGTQPGDIIVISGAGGGLGHLAIQYAISGFGLRVIALDTGDEKKKLCSTLGAESFIDFKSSPDVIAEIKKVADGLGPHAAIVASASSAGYDQALQYLRPGGTLVAVGLPPGAKIEADVFWTVVRSITVKGSYVGNREDARQALDIAARGRVRTTYRVEPLGKLPEVFKEMKEGKLAGRVVLDLWK
ncbi:alcohol dehydrogenase [Rhizoctonia solani AG-1 IB]|uniref:alcohol dehydrogenase n=1 Tax=Thanatephorus cucumeris (strain AG1-IB / isolate 7/3/14) TaxID=1108050 RepID=A0A0B7F895_THACB|nr:alcohol dehydrogenase [Rhizoctonia solani AG-1 IB]